MNRDDLVGVCSRSFSRNELLRCELENHYANIVYNDSGRSLDGDSLIDFLSNCSKAIVALESIDLNILLKLPKLKVISKYGVGLDNLDLKAISLQGIKLGWKAGVNARSVSELALAMMISVLRHIPQCDQEMRSGNFQPKIGSLLSHKTVGIIGCGNVGQDLVRLLAPFNCDVLVYDSLDLTGYCTSVGARQTDLDGLLKSCDIISIHLPLTDNTKNFLNRDRLGLMKPGSVLVNTARGGLVDELALSRLLTEKRLLGAGFDVFEVEPVTNNELLNLPNFLGTPHIGGSANEAILAMGRSAIIGLDTYVDLGNML